MKNLVPEVVAGSASDGCTGFIDGIGKADWRHCCVEHDFGFLFGDSMTDFARANLRLGVCVANEGLTTALEIARQAPGDDWAGWILTMLEAGAYVMGVPLVALAMFAAVSTIGWLFFLRAPRKHLKRTKSMKFEIGQPVSAAYDSKITGQLDATATDPTGLTLWRVDDHWFDELSLVRL